MKTIENKRLGIVFTKALRKRLGKGIYQLDAYNNKVVTEGISITITTRINACSHYWILEINEKDSAT